MNDSRQAYSGSLAKSGKDPLRAFRIPLPIVTSHGPPTKVQLDKYKQLPFSGTSYCLPAAKTSWIPAFPPTNANVRRKTLHDAESMVLELSKTSPTRNSTCRNCVTEGDEPETDTELSPSKRILKVFYSYQLLQKLDSLKRKTITEIEEKIDTCYNKLEVKAGDIEKLKQAQQANKEQGKLVKKEVNQLYFQMECLVGKDTVSAQKKVKLEQKKSMLQGELSKIKETIAKLTEAKEKLMEEAKKLENLEAKLVSENCRGARSEPRQKVRSKLTLELSDRNLVKDQFSMNGSLTPRTPTSIRSIKPLTNVIDALHRELDTINTKNTSISNQILALESEWKSKADQLSELSDEKFKVIDTSPDNYSVQDIFSGKSSPRSEIGTPTLPRSYSTKNIKGELLYSKNEGRQAKLEEIKSSMNEKTQVLAQKKQEYETKITSITEDIKKAELAKVVEAKKEEKAVVETVKSEIKVKALKEELEKLKNTIQQSDDKINDLLVPIANQQKQIKERRGNRCYSDTHLIQRTQRKSSTASVAGGSKSRIVTGAACAIVQLILYKQKQASAAFSCVVTSWANSLPQIQTNHSGFKFELLLPFITILTITHNNNNNR
eukprot:TRINITY_DN1068_c0_g1_i1.p1 TRINITY_DN1068_c0_g1~~TRINITY_DN1068_c0_g1_i1.p1  ORF type:complete len:605 (-),score=66.42 TRINITY_DN1068_c0_g1_i1:5752-7566(-)